MKASVTSIWFDIGPEETPNGLTGPALTMKPSCPLYEADEWLDNDEVLPMTANSSFAYDAFQQLIEKETSLSIMEHDTHYTLQVRVDMSECKKSLAVVRDALQRFVARHFNSYEPVKKRDAMKHFRKTPKRS